MFFLLQNFHWSHGIRIHFFPIIRYMKNFLKRNIIHLSGSGVHHQLHQRWNQKDSFKIVLLVKKKKIIKIMEFRLY